MIRAIRPDDPGIMQHRNYLAGPLIPRREFTLNIRN